ncbi:DUF5686 and carboxypeptidase regulatory-like domain-containing protein [Mucilaginibacter daejeonensis]|uniref:DUF5686 and carboxypeptidase-like regulatory domain-containing protein n=1 Tax=Mucilaginibacter daejeonensis TaxID=398049 RepID=UPI001D17C3F1|nr:DUF5686 and carboxypeptidase-like regulatory domain-containing protein [Mucilaginibacter daejeonensis]UEG53335.1 DUF5686 and carboxypeptidase regulatory-like domain-containing protein [Mucilaginibacter daejeonensis]
MKLFTKIFYTLLILLSSYITGYAQSITVVQGTITDAKTKQPLSFVTVGFAGSSQGAATDNNGHYVIRTNDNFAQIRVTYVGYKTVTRNIDAGKEQTINIALNEDSRQLGDVVVRSGKKKKYTNKNNPAVELIRKVIAHKEQNEVTNYSYAEYKQYERMIFSLSNLSEKFTQKRIFKNYQFMFRHQDDSTAIGGKNMLPLYMEEKLSDNYYRKAPYAQKQVVEANKQVKYDENFVDNQGLTTYFNRMYQDINIYDNNVSLLSNQLLSPIADHSPDYYKFFITDTIKDQQPNLIELSFTPRNTINKLFEGKIYITMDGNYAVQNAFLTVNRNIDLNFVRQMECRLSFEKNSDGRYHLSKSDLKMDFGLNKNKGGGVFGERLVTINNFVIDQPRPKQAYDGPAQVYAQKAEEKDDQYWSKSRPDTLDAVSANIYHNVDSLQHMPSFRRTMDIATLFLAGYKNFGPFEVGPVNTFYSFNPVEGFRGRLGGRTTPTLSKRYYFETYAAYGTKDQKFKYFLSSTYSINNKSIYAFPQNYIRASYQRDTKIPGQELEFVQESNFLLSFKRGANDQWLYNDIFKIDYVHEFLNHFSYAIGFKKWNQSPAGALRFQNLLPNGVLNNVNLIHTTEFSAQVRYAPHEKFYQGKIYRTPIPDKYPVYTLRYTQGLNGFLGGNYDYQNVTANISKRFYASQLGFTDVSVEGGYLFGKVPFPLLDIHRANQSYAFQFQSFNMMNFQEFVSDHYATFTFDHNFNGFLFNKVPLLRRLKLREIINFKGLWGAVRPENNPANDPSLLRFPTNSQGQATTYTLNNGMYAEGSIGVGNIFKLIRFDLVRRFTYLDNPNAPKLGFRTFIKFDF